LTKLNEWEIKLNNFLVNKAIVKILRCPVCGAKVEHSAENGLKCVNSSCQTTFPIIDGIPILINDSNSLFSRKDFVEKKKTFFKAKDERHFIRSIKKAGRQLIPNISKNIRAKKNLTKFSNILKKQNMLPFVLVIGGGIAGQGMEDIISDASIKLFETDVSFAQRTKLICDCHDLPFDNESFDGLIAQAVLEHVIDPYRCVEEIHRVLKKEGLVYAETPFMQQGHGGRYDFTRFTHLGLRRLFRRFDEIGSGAICGPGMALSSSYGCFLASFFKSKLAMRFLSIFVRFTSFWLKYFDYYLIDKPKTIDCASAYYFLGRKSDRAISDRELISLYRGLT